MADDKRRKEEAEHKRKLELDQAARKKADRLKKIAAEKAKREAYEARNINRKKGKSGPLESDSSDSYSSGETVESPRPMMNKPPVLNI